jgi:TRAP-type C4-dicarboxylate transport system permease small subunit
MSYVVTVLKPIIVFLFLAMVAITFLATLARIFPVLPTFYWAGEAARYLNFWITCLGIGIALQLGAHFSLTMFVDALPDRLRRTVAMICQIGALILAGVLIIYGIEMVTWNLGQRSAALEVPMAYIYVGVPICGGLILIHALISIWRIVRGQEWKPVAEDER